MALSFVKTGLNVEGKPDLQMHQLQKDVRQHSQRMQ